MRQRKGYWELNLLYLIRISFRNELEASQFQIVPSLDVSVLEKHSVEKVSILTILGANHDVDEQSFVFIPRRVRRLGSFKILLNLVLLNSFAAIVSVCSIKVSERDQNDLVVVL